MMTVVGSSCMARVTEEQGVDSQSSILLSTRRAQKECGTGIGQGPIPQRAGRGLLIHLTVSGIQVRGKQP